MEVENIKIVMDGSFNEKKPEEQWLKIFKAM